ncbi:flagellar biosynthetic protein FliQ [Hydrogenispora ethanolica]|uniref:Flagellar biosynthetic protein FliQ n=1 Tax=Hydrogenispora ethanolica TaxID=1082276 RepID=A0A4R1RK53_HYDET|nr:flagellar biosynthesis protein FliQ [Hydrogenispora ethanolica]TCL66558.1 flagellar biosynthetic protein FliQ [Hydrogenispora ethanolica]
MTDTFVTAVTREALWTILLISAPLLGIGLVVGLVISIFQATTQIHEQTLSFIPKLVAILVSMVIFGPWMLHTLVSFADKILGNLNQFTFIR